MSDKQRRSLSCSGIVAYFADAAVSDCLANSNLSAARDAGLRAKLLSIVASAPDLEGAFATIRQDCVQAIIALDNRPSVLLPARLLGAHAR